MCAVPDPDVVMLSVSAMSNSAGRCGSRLRRVPLALVGVALLVMHWWPEQRVRAGTNDFLMVYSGARLVGTPDQFNPARYRQEQIVATGGHGPAWDFVRLPAYALALRPLGGLPYWRAYLLWQALLTAALAGFILAWPVRDRSLLAVACCWSFPLSVGFANGQDDTFLLLLLALAVRSAERKPLVAGLLLSMCALKYHLFLALPVALAAARRWRIFAGAAAGVAGILAVSFAVAGLHWPSYHLALVLSSRINPAVHTMPNLRGITAHLEQGVWPEIALAVSVVAAVAFIAARLDFRTALAAALLGGILVSHHAYPADLSLLIPALFVLTERFSEPIMRYTAVALLLPHWFVLRLPGPPGSLTAGIFVAASMGILGYLVMQARRQREGGLDKEKSLGPRSRGE